MDENRSAHAAGHGPAGPEVPPPRLFTYRRCPYAMRARMALLVAGLPFEAFEVVLRDKPAELCALSPKATVPVLQLDPGWVLEQSLDIMEWALAGPASVDWWACMAEPEVRALVNTNDAAFKFHLDRYKYPQRYPGEGDAARHRDAAGRILHGLDQRLATRAGLAGPHPSAADLAVFPFVRQFAAVDPAWFDSQPWPHLRRWLQGWLASPLFAHCMAKIPPGLWVPFPAAGEAARPGAARP